MDKKGFVKTLESIIAVVVIFGAILFILPKVPKLPSGQMPEQLEFTANALIEQIQNDDLFRKCVLTSNNSKINGKTNIQCLNDFLGLALPAYTPWNYGLTICSIPLALKDNLQRVECIAYIGNKDKREFDEKMVYSALAEFESQLPGSNIYTRRILVSVDDVTAIPIASAQIQEYKSVTLYFWE